MLNQVEIPLGVLLPIMVSGTWDVLQKNIEKPLVNSRRQHYEQRSNIVRLFFVERGKMAAMSIYLPSIAIS